MAESIRKIAGKRPPVKENESGVHHVQLPAKKFKPQLELAHVEQEPPAPLPRSKSLPAPPPVRLLHTDFDLLDHHQPNEYGVVWDDTVEAFSKGVAVKNYRVTYNFGKGKLQVEWRNKHSLPMSCYPEEMEYSQFSRELKGPLYDCLATMHNNKVLGVLQNGKLVFGGPSPDNSKMAIKSGSGGSGFERLWGELYASALSHVPDSYKDFLTKYNILPLSLEPNHKKGYFTCATPTLATKEFDISVPAPSSNQEVTKITTTDMSQEEIGKIKQLASKYYKEFVEYIRKGKLDEKELKRMQLLYFHLYVKVYDRNKTIDQLTATNEKSTVDATLLRVFGADLGQKITSVKDGGEGE